MKKCVILRVSVLASGSPDTRTEPVRLGSVAESRSVVDGLSSEEIERSVLAGLVRVTLDFFCSQRSREF